MTMNGRATEEAEDEKQKEAEKKKLSVQVRGGPRFAKVLHDNKLSVFISTYQAGLIASVWAEEETKVKTLLSRVPKPMGMAASNNGIAIAERHGVSIYRPSPKQRVKGYEGQFDAVFTPRLTYQTGAIDAHDVAWRDDEVIVVNTLFSNLSTLNGKANYVPFWAPPFISGKPEQDKCHLHGLAMKNGKPAFVTALGETNTKQGWRDNKDGGGCIIDVETGETVLRGLSMPHSPRFHGDDIIYINSGRGELCRFKPDGTNEVITDELPGFGRGMRVVGKYAFVALSKAREKKPFGDLPITDGSKELRCAICLIDLETGKLLALYEFVSGVTELFEVSVLPIPKACLLGPDMANEGFNRIWATPRQVFST